MSNEELIKVLDEIRSELFEIREALHLIFSSMPPQIAAGQIVSALNKIAQRTQFIIIGQFQDKKRGARAAVPSVTSVSPSPWGKELCRSSAWG